MSYKIIQADLYIHKQDILKIWQRNFPEAIDPPKRYSWLLKNPCGLPKCWLAQDPKTDKFIGCTSLVPRRMLFNGELVTAGIATDFAIDKKYRGFGPALKLQKAVISEVENGNYKFIYGFPNKMAEPIHLRTGYEILGKTLRMVKLMPVYFKFTRDCKYFDKKVGTLIDFILQITSKEIKYKRYSDLVIETPIFFDERFDTLWNKVSHQKKIIGERTFLYLNWRYIENPSGLFKIFTIYNNHKKEILGYIIYKCQNDIAYVFDLLSQDKEDYLFLTFIKNMRYEGVAKIYLMIYENHPLISKLKNFGFFKRPQDLSIVAYINDQDAPLESIKGEFYMMAGVKDVP